MHPSTEGAEQARKARTRRLITDLDPTGRLPHRQRRPPAESSRQVFLFVEAQCDVGTSPEDRRQGEESCRSLTSACRQAHRQAGLELYDQGLVAPSEQADLTDRYESAAGEVAMSRSQRVQREDFHLLIISTKAQHVSQQRGAVSAGRWRHGSDDQDPHPNASSDASIAFNTRSQV
jgi:hypothetical protein